MLDVAQLYVQSGWGNASDYDSSTLSLMLENSSAIYVAQSEIGQIVGVARALSDHCSVTWICEVLVSPESRGEGIGSQLVKAIRDKFSATAIYLEAFQGTEQFFQKTGIPPRQKLVACGAPPEKPHQK